MEERLNKLGIDDSERQGCECWTRVMGYFRETKRYNPGKLSEYNERKFYKEDVNK